MSLLVARGKLLSPKRKYYRFFAWVLCCALIFLIIFVDVFEVKLNVSPVLGMFAILVFVLSLLVVCEYVYRPISKQNLLWVIWLKHEDIPSLGFNIETIKGATKIWEEFKPISYKKAIKTYGVENIDFLVLAGALKIVFPGRKFRQKHWKVNPEDYRLKKMHLVK